MGICDCNSQRVLFVECVPFVGVAIGMVDVHMSIFIPDRWDPVWHWVSGGNNHFVGIPKRGSESTQRAPATPMIPALCLVTRHLTCWLLRAELPHGSMPWELVQDCFRRPKADPPLVLSWPSLCLYFHPDCWGRGTMGATK